ncbi:ABC transporter permease [Actinophytocola oryzae]|uniref:ABC-2 type transport system permease protein n=1 Tax=Actinophytocola oryzae TaxID=502181 RepID=A0A4R7VN50_9PSEU|nr:ABC transporter permease [Actinophytocola oryzae]TDV50765.1 ABC-2 type transport system permease protein [Actinophytocola oryzae]
MTLLAVERIKLFTTRSPLWCTIAAIAVVVGFAALIAGVDTDNAPTIASTQFGANFGLMIVMVMAALAITTEYRFGTIRATFQAIPNRTGTLLAKTLVVAVFAGLIGEVVAFGSVAIAKLIKPSADLAINSSFEWRAVAGVGVVYALAAVVAIAVGTLIRHSAGAVSLLLIYTLLVESLVALIPNVGLDIQKWMPFQMANMFLAGDPDATNLTVNGEGPPAATAGLGPWGALAYFAGFAVLMLIIAVTTANKRDA